MFSAALARRATEGKPVRVGIIGAGKFGGGLLVQLAQMKGMAVCAVAAKDLERARTALLASGAPAGSIQLVESAGAMAAAIHRGKCAITQDGLLVAGAEPVEVVVEATGLPEAGARLAYEAIQQGKHVVMVNVEADVTVGPLLRRLADRAGVVYTLVDGDQPGVIMNLIEWARTLGFEVVAAGRGTLLYADDREGTPDTVPQRFGFDAETLARRSINLKMFNSFRDGTKSQVEMTALANMAGLVPDVQGMHEPAANIRDLARIFSRREEGGILGRHGVVELANSVAEEDGRTLLDDPLKMGVFVVIRAEHPFIQEDLQNYYLHSGGDGHNFLLYRPYHLVAVEAPISIAKAALYGQPTGAPLPTPMAEVITVAKRDLKQGEALDGSGGYTVYGLCERAEVARVRQYLPLGLADRVRLTQPVRRGEPITYGMVELAEDSFVLKLRRLQDAVVW